MQLLGKAKFLTEDENPKGKMRILKKGGGANFLKGAKFPRNLEPRERDITRNFAPLGQNCRGEGCGGEIPGTPVLLNSRGCEFSLRDSVNTITQLLRLNFLAKIT